MLESIDAKERLRALEDWMEADVARREQEVGFEKPQVKQHINADGSVSYIPIKENQNA